MSLCLYVSELLESMPANEKLPISKARLLRLFNDARKGFFVCGNAWNSRFVRRVDERDGFKQKESFNLVSSNSVMRVKAFEVSLLLGLLKANLFLKIL